MIHSFSTPTFQKFAKEPFTSISVYSTKKKAQKKEIKKWWIIPQFCSLLFFNIFHFDAGAS